jgi:hypothetical protein
LAAITVRAEGHQVFLTENGVTSEVPATPELLDALRKAGGSVTLTPDANLIMSGGGGSAFNYAIPWPHGKSAPPSSADEKQQPAATPDAPRDATPVPPPQSHDKGSGTGDS